MLRKFGHIWQFLKKSIWLIIPILAIGLVEYRLDNQRCANLVINIEGDLETRFLNQNDILKLATQNGSDPLTGRRLNEIRLAEVEKRIIKNKLIRKCQVFRDLKGNLVVNVEQEKPLARWLGASDNGEWKSASGLYLNENGQFFPLSDSYTARTLLITGSYFADKKQLNESGEFMKLIKFLDEDEFWNAQIFQLDIKLDGEISMLTLLGDQVIEFGTSDNFINKLSKLRLFYTKVLSRDWSRYSKISVKYQDQIVCE